MACDVCFGDPSAPAFDDPNTSLVRGIARGWFLCGKCGEVFLRLTLKGAAPRTKKNRPTLDLRGPKPKHLASKPYRGWNDVAQKELAVFRAQCKIALPIEGEINCRVIVYRDRAAGDANGYYQAIADTLQEGRIVVNDSQIVAWDGSRMRVDNARPRVEINLSRFHDE